MYECTYSTVCVTRLFVFSTLSVLSQQKKKKKKKKDDDDDDDYTQAPRIYLIFPEEASHKYQLRAYIYQARDMHGSDESGLSGESYTCIYVCTYRTCLCVTL